MFLKFYKKVNLKSILGKREAFKVLRKNRLEIENINKNSFSKKGKEQVLRRQCIDFNKKFSFKDDALKKTLYCRHA